MLTAVLGDGPVGADILQPIESAVVMVMMSLPVRVIPLLLMPVVVEGFCDGSLCIAWRKETGPKPHAAALPVSPRQRLFSTRLQSPAWAHDSSVSITTTTIDDCGLCSCARSPSIRLQRSPPSQPV